MARKPNSSPQTRELLIVMLRKPRAWHYGYELSRDTGLSSGTLYPVLMRLSDQGLLESHWQESERPSKPPRHVYKLTSEGLALARAIAEQANPAVVRNTVAGATT
jgi:DNA-binding PadR family transcriptional regulator